MVTVPEERSINVTLVCIRRASALSYGKCVSIRLRAPLIAYRVSIVLSPRNILDVIWPSNSPPPDAEDDEAGDDEDEVEFGVAPPHAATNAAIRRTARERIARGELLRDLNR